MIEREEAQKQVAAIAAEFKKQWSEVSEGARDAQLLDRFVGGAATRELPNELQGLPFEAYMAAFARVYEGPMVEAIKALAPFGFDITTPGWFAITDPKPTKERLNAQFGVHLEEVGEMLEAVTSSDKATADKMLLLETLLAEVSHEFKSGKCDLLVMNRRLFEDSIDDQRVTGQGTGKLSGMNCAEVAARVDWANHTKFVNRTPIYKDGGKVGKGPYFEEAKEV